MKMTKILAVLGASAMMTAGLGMAAMADPVAVEDVKVGIIYIGDEQEGYTEAHMKGIAGMKEALSLSDDQVIEYFNIGENEDCYNKAVDLAEQGCQIVFGNSFGHEDYLMMAAEEYPEVQFCHATGYQAADSGLDNMHNYFTSVYESRYVSGLVAGLKLVELDAAGAFTDANYAEDGTVKIGYVGAFSYAEIISGYTAFLLGVRDVYPNVTMEVKYTGSWADQALEKEAATALADDGCVLISQHADTTGAASACQEKGVYHVGYNVAMLDVAPDYSLTSATISWAPFYTAAVASIIEDEEIPVDVCLGYESGSVGITELGSACPEGTQEIVDAAWEALASGEVHVFDTSKFTVGGETITSTEEDLGLEYISEDGTYFMESTLASAPSFSYIVDGVVELNQMF